MKFFDHIMRNAAPVLFWASILLFMAGFALTLLLELGLDVRSYPSGSKLDARSFVSAIYQGLKPAVWPFMGAGIIWTLQNTREGDAQ